MAVSPTLSGILVVREGGGDQDAPCRRKVWSVERVVPLGFRGEWGDQRCRIREGGGLEVLPGGVVVWLEGEMG